MNNVDLIYRSVAEDALTMLGAQLPESKTKAVARCVMEIHQLPSADALPVRYAEWIYDPADIGGYACSECRTRNENMPSIRVSRKVLEELVGTKYCPECGAKMIW